MKNPLEMRFHSGARKRTKQQHTSPCADCPWARKSIPGWLGEHTAEEWLLYAHGEAIIPCHCVTHQCAGAAIYRANVCKRVPEGGLKLPSDKNRVFSFNEFKAHHEAKLKEENK